VPSGQVELARRLYTAIESADLDAMLEFVAPDFELHTSGEFPGDAAVYRGRDGYVRFWQEWWDLWSEFRFAVEELRECGDVVAALYWLEGETRNGPRVRRRGGEVVRFRGEVMVRVDAYGSWEETLEAAGA